MFLKLLQLSTCCVFLGRAWQHLYWDAPFRALLWDEKLMSPIINRFTSMNWETYITSMEVNDTITLSIKIMGGLYLFCAIIPLIVNKLPAFLKYFLLLGSISLMLLALLYCKERFYSAGQFFEYALQFGSPLFLFWWVKGVKADNIPNFLLILKITIALTFSAHGLYALGYYPMPVHFMEMTMNILGGSEDIAKTFLTTVGIMDFVISIGIFLPWRWSKYFLLYTILWGLSTSIARIWANFYWGWLDYVLLQWLHESVMRMPHFLIPLAVFSMGRRVRDKN